MEAATHPSRPEPLITQVARQLLALQVAKLNKEQQERVTSTNNIEHRSLSPPGAAEAPLPKQQARHVPSLVNKPWLPSGAPGSVWGRRGARSDVTTAHACYQQSTKTTAASTKDAPSSPVRKSSTRVSNDKEGDGYERTQSSAAQARRTRSCPSSSSGSLATPPRRTSDSPQRSYKGAGYSVAAATRAASLSGRSSSAQARNHSPLRGRSTAGVIDMSLTRLDSTSGNCNSSSSSTGGAPGEFSNSSTTGACRLPYHEVLQLAYGPPVSSAAVLRSHLDLVAPASGPAATAANIGQQQPDSSSPSPYVPSLLSTKGSSRRSAGGLQAPGAQCPSAPGTTAAAAAMGAAVAAATTAAALLSHRTTAESAPSPTETQAQQVLRGFTSGYIDGRLAALRGSSAGKTAVSDSSASGESSSGAEASAAFVGPTATLADAGGDCVEQPQVLCPSECIAGAVPVIGAPDPDDNRPVEVEEEQCPVVARHISKDLQEVESDPTTALRPSIRPELVKQIAMKIVSAALATPDSTHTPAPPMSSAANASAAEPQSHLPAPAPAAPIGTKAAAEALLAAQPGQLRNLLEKMQRVLPPQRQMSTELAPLRKSNNTWQQHQHQHQQPQRLRDDFLLEYSVSAFDRETDAYLIPVSHIGCQTSEVFSDIPVTGQPRQQGDLPHQSSPHNAAALTKAIVEASTATLRQNHMHLSSSSSDSKTWEASEWAHQHSMVEQCREGAVAAGTESMQSNAPSQALCSDGTASRAPQQQQQHTHIQGLLQCHDVCCQAHHAAYTLSEKHCQQEHIDGIAACQQSQCRDLGSLQADLQHAHMNQQHCKVVPDVYAMSAASGSKRDADDDQVSNEGDHHHSYKELEGQQPLAPLQNQNMDQAPLHDAMGAAAPAAAALKPGAAVGTDAPPGVKEGTASSPGSTNRESLARIEALLQAMHDRAQQQLVTAQQLHAEQGLLQDTPKQQQQQCKAPSHACGVGAADASYAGDDAAAGLLCTPAGSMSINGGTPLSPRGSSSLLGLQVLERLMAELRVLQHSVKGHAGVDQLDLSRLDALMAQVALLNHWLVERCGAGHPVSAQLALLQQDLQIWRSRVGADIRLHVAAPAVTHDGPPSPNRMSQFPAAPVSPRFTRVPVSPGRSPDGGQRFGTFPRMRVPIESAPGRQQQSPLPEQQLLAPILSGGLLRTRSAPSHAHGWHKGLAPVQEGRESECDTVSSVGDAASVHSLASSQAPSIAGRSSNNSSISLVMKSSSNGGRSSSILSSVGVDSSYSGGGTTGSNRHRITSGSQSGGFFIQDVQLQPELKHSRHHDQSAHHAEAFGGLLKPAGWLSPRGRTSFDHTQGTFNTNGQPSSTDMHNPWPVRSLASRSVGAELYAVDINGYSTSGSCSRGGSGAGTTNSRISGADKKRGFMKALKKTLQENMQQLGGKKRPAVKGS